MTPWRTALPDSLRAEALVSLQEIVEALPAPGSGIGGSLAGGEAGLAIFHAYYALTFPGDRSRAEAHLELACENVFALATMPHLYSGFPGVAWTVEHLQKIGFLDSDEDLNEEVDLALMPFLAGDPRDYLCELIGGLAGYGLYGLARAARPTGRALVARAVTLLEASAERQGDRVTWFHAPALQRGQSRLDHPRGCYNLGLSHGIPGAIGFLAQAAALGEERALPLVEGAVAWLLDEQEPQANGSLYTYSFYPGDERTGSRMAWCYGDLGICAVLLLAARALNRADWESAALALARRAADRPMEGSGVVDAGLCHGWFGNAHIFNRLWQATGEDLFHRAFLRWFSRGLAMREPGAHLGGYWAHQPFDNNRRPQDPRVPVAGVLEGTAGIGLALLAALGPLEPAWDTHLLLNIPPRTFFR